MSTVTELTTEARKPFFATVGLGQLAVEQARVLPKTVPAELTKLQEQARTSVKTLPSTVSAQVKSLPTAVQTLPTTVQTLPTTVQSQVKAYTAKSQELYADLATRGEKLVDTFRRQPSTQVAEKDIKDTAAQVKGTATLAKKAAKSSTAAVNASSNGSTGATGSAGSAGSTAKGGSTEV